MNDWSTRAIMGVFKDRDDADKAIDDLQRLGYGINDISVIMNEGTRLRAFGTEKGSRGGEGVAVGAAAGGALGAIVAGLTATGSIAAVAATGGAAAPLVVGPLAAALAGLGVGAAGGGILGGLVGLGIPEVRAKEYQRDLDDGGILVSVRANPGTEDEVRSALIKHKATIY
ncbi:MAG TPA: hypothetical protein VID19_11800 [Candidatus Eremiobacteraceae bacterium]|jgi:hypothetical protein